MPGTIQQQVDAQAAAEAVQMGAATRAAQRRNAKRVQPTPPIHFQTVNDGPRTPTLVRVRREAFQQYERQLQQEKKAGKVVEEEKPPEELPPPVPRKEPNEEKAAKAAEKAKKKSTPKNHSILSTRAPLYSEEKIKNNPGAPAEPNMCDPGKIAEVRAALSHLQGAMMGKCSADIVAADRMIMEISSNVEKTLIFSSPMCQSSKWVREANSAIKQVELCVNQTIKTAARLRNDDFDKMQEALADLKLIAKSNLNLNKPKPVARSVPVAPHDLAAAFAAGASFLQAGSADEAEEEEEGKDEKQHRNHDEDEAYEGHKQDGSEDDDGGFGGLHGLGHGHSGSSDIFCFSFPDPGEKESRLRAWKSFL